jgi:hypothetical protein
MPVHPAIMHNLATSKISRQQITPFRRGEQVLRCDIIESRVKLFLIGAIKNIWRSDSIIFCGEESVYDSLYVSVRSKT